MPTTKLCSLLVVLLIGVQGCGVARHLTFDRAAVRQSLPPNVSLDLRVRYSPDKKDTVEGELIRLGAHVDGKGTLRDASGKEIRFYFEPVPTGVWSRPMEPTPEQLRKGAEWEQIRKDCTVITIIWNQNGEPAPS
jgi:hypothetical protein